MTSQHDISGIQFRIRHTMLPVSNLDRSIDFYTRVFKMDIQRLRNAPERNERVAYVGYGCEDDFHALADISGVDSHQRRLSSVVDF